MEKYPKDKVESINNLHDKRKTFSFINSLNFPDVSHINIDSHFIYDEASDKIHYCKLSNKNLIKPNYEEIQLLNNISDEIKTKNISLDNKETIVKIKVEYAQKLFSQIPIVKNEKNELVYFVKNIIEKNKNRECISCRKIAFMYEKTFKKKIGKSTIHKIL